MRVLVTGHAGFIGTHLTRELEEHGYEVEGHDKLQGDLTIPGVFTRHLDDCEPDLVIHLAAQVGRLFGEQDLAHTIESNATMTALVAKACGAAKVPVLYASSSEVYGDRGTYNCHEVADCVLPHSLYGLTKRWGEELLQLYAPEGLRIVRLSMPAGPGAPPGVGRRALDTFLWQALHVKPLTVHRGAERSWCHVKDTVAGIRLVLESGLRLEHRGTRGYGIFNVGRDDKPVAMEALARMCCDIAGAPYDLIEFVDPPAAQTVVKRLDTSKLRSLGWWPRRELPEILADTYKWVECFDREGNYQPFRAKGVRVAPPRRVLEGDAAGLAGITGQPLR
jgi:nucleoside-diphosphate-sugar epimerase